MERCETCAFWMENTRDARLNDLDGTCCCPSVIGLSDLENTNRHFRCICYQPLERSCDECLRANHCRVVAVLRDHPGRRRFAIAPTCDLFEPKEVSR